MLRVTVRSADRALDRLAGWWPPPGGRYLHPTLATAANVPPDDPRDPGGRAMSFLKRLSLNINLAILYPTESVGQEANPEKSGARRRKVLRADGAGRNAASAAAAASAVQSTNAPTTIQT